MQESLMPTCFGNATLETLKVTSPYPTLGDSIAQYTKQRTGVSDSNSKLRGSKQKLNRQSHTQEKAYSVSGAGNQRQ